MIKSKKNNKKKIAFTFLHHCIYIVKLGLNTLVFYLNKRLIREENYK